MILLQGVLVGAVLGVDREVGHQGDALIHHAITAIEGVHRIRTTTALDQEVDLVATVVVPRVTETSEAGEVR